MWFSGLGQCFDKKPAESEAFVKALVGKGDIDYWDCNGLSALYADLGGDGTKQSIEWLERASTIAKNLAGPEANKLQAVALLQIGNLYYKDKDFVKSTQLFEQAVALIPDNPSALNNAAYLIAKGGTNAAKAVELARKCVELNPNVDDFQDTLGFALIKDGKSLEALEPLQKAIVMTQKPGSMIHLAQAFIELKRPADAKEYLEKAKTKSPTAEQIAEIQVLELKLN
jgi:tetratricopeptide (TPR) repeat protein